MIYKIIEFRVLSRQIPAVESCIRNFLSEIKRCELQTLFYHSYQKKDNPASFVHVMAFKDDKAERQHKNAVYTKDFIDMIYPLCEYGPDYYEVDRLMPPIV